MNTSSVLLDALLAAATHMWLPSKPIALGRCLSSTVMLELFASCQCSIATLRGLGCGLMTSPAVTACMAKGAYVRRVRGRSSGWRSTRTPIHT